MASMGSPTLSSRSGLCQNQHRLSDYITFKNRGETIPCTCRGRLHAQLRLFHTSQPRAGISFTLGKPER